MRQSIRTNIPGPNRWTTLRGLVPVPFRRFPGFLSAMTARYGNVFAFALPWRSYVFLNEPALIKDMLVTQQHAFSKSLGTRVLRLLLGDGLLTSEDPLHRNMRRIVQPAFHHQRIAEYARVMERDAADFRDRLVPDSAFDAHAAMTALTLRIATETLFGSDESASAAAVADSLRLMMTEFPAMLTPIGALRQRLPLRNTRRFWRARHMLDAIIYDLIARRRSDGVDRGDALSMLLEAFAKEDKLCHPEPAPKGPSRRASDEQIRDEIMTLFMAGHETTANALTWSLYLLAQHQAIDERAGAAARAGDVAFIARVVKEVLRLYPPAWIIGRETLRDVTLSDGSCIPQGTTVFAAPLLLHRRAEYFADPQTFNPERWLGPEPAPFSYVPFGGGARRCIGEEFALHEIAIVLFTLLARYRFELRPDARVEIAPLVTLRPGGPVMVRAVLREDGLRNEAIRSATIGEPALLNERIRLEQYDPRWPSQFEKEAATIRNALGERALLVEHVGSTAVSGLVAKPFVDIVLEVAGSSDEQTYIPALEAAGYLLRIREPHWHEHRLLEDAAASTKLHVFSRGSSETLRMLRFRDRLRDDEPDRDLYGSTKRALARRTWKHVQDYADAKSLVIEEILGRASP